MGRTHIEASIASLHIGMQWRGPDRVMYMIWMMLGHMLGILHIRSISRYISLQVVGRWNAETKRIRSLARFSIDICRRASTSAT